MTQLINELLDVSRLQTGRPLDLVRNDADLIDLLTRLVSEQQQTTDRHRIRMETDLTDLRGYWDEQRLERTFTNIVSNAVRYSPHGGEILIRVSRSDESEPEAVIAVRDEGMGIPEHDLALVFDRFHRGSNVSGRIPGTGIGLAGSLQIVQQHGGTISVDSKEGAGTTFVVRLPIVSSADEVNESRALEPGAPVGAPE
jgi:signal transduction histidine kinase